MPRKRKKVLVQGKLVLSRWLGAHDKTSCKEKRGKVGALALVSKDTASYSTNKTCQKKHGYPEAVLTITDNKQTEVIQGKFLFLQPIFSLDL